MNTIALSQSIQVRATLKHGFRKPESGTGNQHPAYAIRNPQSAIQNPDIMNDDRTKSLQQGLINKYREKLPCCYLFSLFYFNHTLQLLKSS